jgi:hypothetical protein
MPAGEECVAERDKAYADQCRDMPDMPDMPDMRKME